MSSASLILTDGGLALSERKAVGAQGSTKVLAASSLGSCLVFVSSAVVTVALAAIGRDMRLSPLELQWVMNAELLPLAALTLVAGALGDRFGQKRIFLAGIALYGLGATAIGFAPSFAPLIVGRFLQGLGEALILPNGLSVLGQAFPADKKARAVGIWSAAAAVASGVAPAIAGAILDQKGRPLGPVIEERAGDRGRDAAGDSRGGGPDADRTGFLVGGKGLPEHGKAVGQDQGFA